MGCRKACMSEGTVEHHILTHVIPLHCHSLMILGFLLSYLCALSFLSLCVSLASASLPSFLLMFFIFCCRPQVPVLLNWSIHASERSPGGRISAIVRQSGRVTSIERKEGSSRGQEGCIFVRGDRCVQQE